MHVGRGVHGGFEAILEISGFVSHDIQQEFERRYALVDGFGKQLLRADGKRAPLAAAALVLLGFVPRFFQQGLVLIYRDDVIRH